MIIKFILFYGIVCLALLIAVCIIERIVNKVKANKHRTELKQSTRGMKEPEHKKMISDYLMSLNTRDKKIPTKQYDNLCDMYYDAEGSIPLTRCRETIETAKQYETDKN